MPEDTRLTSKHIATLVPALTQFFFLHVKNETSIQTSVNFKKVELFTGRREDHIHSTFEHLKLWQTKTMRASAHAVTLVTKQ